MVFRKNLRDLGGMADKFKKEKGVIANHLAPGDLGDLTGQRTHSQVSKPSGKLPSPPKGGTGKSRDTDTKK